MLSSEPLALHPFRTSESPYTLVASMRRHSGLLELFFQLDGPLQQLLLPEPSNHPERRDHLWQATCFECFFTSPQEHGYRELNLSPAGHWNLYRFTGYRQGMRQEERVDALPWRRQRSSTRLVLRADLDPRALHLRGRALQIGFCAVLLGMDGSLSHWALAHPADKADFHDPRGFVARLPAPPPHAADSTASLRANLD